MFSSHADRVAWAMSFTRPGLVDAAALAVSELAISFQPSYGRAVGEKCAGVAVATLTALAC